MSASEFKSAVRFVLGLPPKNAAATCRCGLKVRFRTDPAHFLACPKGRRTGQLERHNDIVDVIKAHVKQAFPAATVEVYRHGQSSEPNVPPLIVNGVKSISNLRCDGVIQIDPSLPMFYYDVSVVHLASKSYIKAFPAGDIQGPILQRDGSKRSKYQPHFDHDPSKVFYPFVVDSYGGIRQDSGADQMLREIATQIHQYRPNSFDKDRWIRDIKQAIATSTMRHSVKAIVSENVKALIETGADEHLEVAPEAEAAAQDAEDAQEDDEGEDEHY